MDQKSDTVISCRVSKWRFVSKLSESEKLRLHRAAGHLSIPNVSVHCEDCVLTKGAKLGHAKSSDPNRRAKVPLEQLNIDFWGPIPKSKDNNTFVIVVICDVSAYVWMYPVKSKDAVVDVVSKLIKEVRATEGVVLNDKVIHTVRSDNEAVFRSNAWRQMLLAANVKEAHSACYSPSMNGVCERFMRTLADNLRANLRGTDQTLWDYCVRYVAWTWNRIPRPRYNRHPIFNGLAPKDVLAKRPRRGT